MVRLAVESHTLWYVPRKSLGAISLIRDRQGQRPNLVSSLVLWTACSTLSLRCANCTITMRLAHALQETDRAYLLRVSYIEIYNETLRDLLNPKKGPLKDDEKPAIHFNKVRYAS